MNGGRFTGSFAFDIASAAGATGTVNVDGPGSWFEVYSSFGRIAPASGNAATVTLSNFAYARYDDGLQIAAAGGTALVNISSNASLTTASLIVGSASPGSAATINLDGGGLFTFGPISFRNGVVVNHTAGALSAGGTLVTSGDAQVLLSAGGNKVPRAFRLNMSGTSKIDLADNDMIIEDTAPATIRGYIQTGRNGGDWLGNFLTSSSAATDPTHKALGYAQASDIFGGGGGTFDGVAVGSGAVLVKFTYAGDANLDGAVDIRDLYTLASHYNTGGDVWSSADFNYDGLTNVADLTLLAMNWQAGVGAPLSAPLGQALLSLGLPDVAVPEPAVLTAFLVLGSLLPRRRR
jgi:hypothetical protein